MPNNKKILIFNVPKLKQQQIANICDKCCIDLIVVEPDSYGESIGALAGIVGMKKTNRQYKGDGIASEMLVFSGINSDELDVFLKEYKNAWIAPIQLKAVLTAYNVRWTVCELYAELMKEHLQF